MVSLDEDVSTLTKGERTRLRLLDIAVQRFGAQGYRGTSVTEIAREAGLTQAAAYAYFRNKDELFRSAVHADASALIDDSVALVADAPVRELAPAVLLFALAALDRHPLTRRVLEGSEPEAVVHIREMATLGRITDVLAERIRTGQERGQVRGDIDPVLVANGVEALILSLLMSAVHSTSTADDRYLEGVVEVFDALLRPPSR